MTIHETTDLVQAIGREFLTPFPKGWHFTLWTTKDGCICTALSGSNAGRPWPVFDQESGEVRVEKPKAG